MRVRSTDAELDARIEGTAHAPCVTFVGGITNDRSLWDAQVAGLCDRLRIVTFDARGHGASNSTPAPYSLETLAADVVAVWDALGIERSCVAGLGLGGVVAAEVAWRHAARVTGLVPVSCRARLTPQYQAIWPPMIERARADGVASIAEATLARWFTAEFRASHAQVIDRMRKAIVATTLDGYLGSIAALMTLDWWERLPAFAMPVMFVSGEHDRVGAPPEVMQAMCERTPGATHVVLPGASHISVVCNPRAFNDALRAFAARLPA